MGVVLCQAWSESQWTVLMGYLTIWSLTDDNFSFRKTALCVQHGQNSAALSTNTAFGWKMWFSCFAVLPGSAEAQVIWGGIVKRVLIAYFIGNISTKNYQNPFMHVKVIASIRWDVFLRRSAYLVCVTFWSWIWTRGYCRQILHWKHKCCSFWATICKMVRPMLSDRCLSVCMQVSKYAILLLVSRPSVKVLVLISRPDIKVLISIL